VRIFNPTPIKGAGVGSHPNERAWIEDAERQQQERPFPGFAKLVAGSVLPDRLLTDEDVLSCGEDLKFLHLFRRVKCLSFFSLK
jgi:hypothetical protein